jgi:L-fuconolactonase
MLDFAIIDSHVHLLDQTRFGYGWAAGLPALARDWRLDDLVRSAKPYEIEGVVFVEVDVDSPQHLDEAEWVDGLAASDGRLKGAVVGLPMEQGGALEPEMARVAALATTRGVRRLIQNQPDVDFALRPGFIEALKLLPGYGLSFDICIHHSQMAAALEMARRCPEVSFVLDHIAKPAIGDGLLEPWRSQLAEMARMPNVVCKLSGLITEADHGAWTAAQLQPYIDHVVESFGPDRILYGGDWPVAKLAGDYLQWLTTLEAATAHFSQSERRKLFRDNAKRVYRL